MIWIRAGSALSPKRRRRETSPSVHSRQTTHLFTSRSTVLEQAQPSSEDPRAKTQTYAPQLSALLGRVVIALYLSPSRSKYKGMHPTTIPLEVGAIGQGANIFAGNA